MSRSDDAGFGIGKKEWCTVRSQCSKRNSGDVGYQCVGLGLAGLGPGLGNDDGVGGMDLMAGEQPFSGGTEMARELGRDFPGH